MPLTKWWMAAHMLNSGKNGVSAHEIHRTIGVTYKTAWFMMHRLREAMSGMSGGAMGGSGHSVQADETYYGNSSKRAKYYRKGHSHKAGIVALVEPKGRVKAFQVKSATAPKSAKFSLPTCGAIQNCIPMKAASILMSAENLPRIRPSNTAGTKAAFMSAKTARPLMLSKTFSAISSAA